MYLYYANLINELHGWMTIGSILVRRKLGNQGLVGGVRRKLGNQGLVGGVLSSVDSSGDISIYCSNIGISSIIISYMHKRTWINCLIGPKQVREPAKKVPYTFSQLKHAVC